MTRRRPPLVDHWDSGFAAALDRCLAEAPGAVAWAAGRDPRRFFDAAAPRIAAVSPALLDGRDALAAAETLGAHGFAFVLTDRTAERVAPWLEDGLDRLALRLRDGLDTPGFVAVALGSGWALHRVDTGPPHGRAGLVAEVVEGRLLATRTDRQAADLLRRPADRTLVVDLHGPPCLIADRDPAALSWSLDVGRHGLRVDDTLLAPSRPLTEGVHAPVILLESAVRDAGLEAFLRPARHPAVARTRPRVLFEAAWSATDSPPLYRIPTRSYLVGPEGAQALYRCVPLIDTADVDRDRIRRALRLGAERLVADQLPDGGFRHLYRPGRGAFGRARTDGQVLIALALATACRHQPDPRFPAAARKALAALPDAPLDARGTALAVLALLDLAGHQPLGDMQEGLNRLTRALLDHPPTPAATTPGTSDALVLLATARLARHGGHEAATPVALERLAALREAWATLRAARTPDGVWTEDLRIAMTGIAPWAAQAADDLHAVTGGPDVAAFGLDLQDWVAEALLCRPDRCRADDWLGGLFKRHDEAPAITSCRGLSAAAAALSLARRSGAPTGPYRDATSWGARFCLQLQYDGPATTWFVPDPDAARGGFRYGLTHTHVRSDWTARAVLALCAADAALGPEAAS